MNFIENESEKKTRKAMYVLAPMLMVFVIVGVIFGAYFVTQIVEDMNIVLPNTLSITRFTENNWAGSRNAMVRKESTMKKIVKCINHLDLEQIDDAPVYTTKGSSYHVNLEFEDEEDGSIRIEAYYITGNYILINNTEWNTLSKKEAENLKDILDDALNTSRTRNDMQEYR